VLKEANTIRYRKPKPNPHLTKAKIAKNSSHTNYPFSITTFKINVTTTGAKNSQPLRRTPRHHHLLITKKESPLPKQDHHPHRKQTQRENIKTKTKVKLKPTGTGEEENGTDVPEKKRTAPM
jgi:hypothetical protein